MLESSFSGMIHSCDGVRNGKVPKSFYLRACGLCQRFSHCLDEALLTG
jgi:hypothetical protein